MTCEQVPAWQFMGEVVKIDGRRILDQAPNGLSPAYTVDMVKQTEQEIGRDVRAGDVVLYWSGYVDKYDQPGEAGKRLHIAPLEGTAPSLDLGSIIGAILGTMLVLLILRAVRGRGSGTPASRKV